MDENMKVCVSRGTKILFSFVGGAEYFLLLCVDGV
jgi:hypothetical protein